MKRFLLCGLLTLGLVLGLTGGTRADIPKSGRPRTARTVHAGPVTPRQAKKVFRWLAAQKDISFHMPSDGCFARAHLMVRRMQRLGLRPGKVWSFANPDSLRVRTRFHPGGYVEWKYHVAPFLQVRSARGKIVNMVLDPSLFNRPVSVAAWRNAQKKYKHSRPYICKTRFGQSPTLPGGARAAGSGYWPAKDPARGPDSHARKVMRLLKPYEGRVLPARVAAQLRT
jgi:Glutaminase